MEIINMTSEDIDNLKKLSLDFFNAMGDLLLFRYNNVLRLLKTLDDFTEDDFQKHFNAVSLLNKYRDYFLSRRENLLNNQLKIVIDLANGAFSPFSQFFKELNIDTVNDKPNGKNINENVGALFPYSLQELVKKNNYDYGFCFDGDGDRVILVTKDHIYDGDDLVYFLSKELSYQEIVVTKQSNLGLINALKELVK